MLLVESVNKTYPNGTQALDHAKLEVRPGEIVAVVGGSGCGKSTLLRLIAGLDMPTHGRIQLDGEMIRSPLPTIGLVFQEPRLLPWLTVAQNIGFGLYTRPRAERERLVNDVLQHVGLADYANSWPRELSGGQAQRVAIARALAQRPLVMLADEPVASLDPEAAQDIMQLLRGLAHNEGHAVLCVLHQVDLAFDFADRVVGMRDGRIEFDAQRADLSRDAVQLLYLAEAA